MDFLHLEANECATKQVEQRKDESVSPEESRALKLMLETCVSYRSQEISCQEELRFLSDTLTLVARIASIYYPNEKTPM